MEVEGMDTIEPLFGPWILISGVGERFLFAATAFMTRVHSSAACGSSWTRNSCKPGTASRRVDGELEVGQRNSSSKPLHPNYELPEALLYIRS